MRKISSIKPWRFFLPIAYAVAAVIMSYSGVLSQGAPMNVLDYYLALPMNYFVCDNYAYQDSKEARLKLIQKKNIPNGYIKAAPGGFELEVAFYADKKLNVSCAVATIACGAGCQCSRFDVYQAGKDGKLVDVTKSLFPDDKVIYKASKGNPVEYKLPEIGTAITVIDSLTGKAVCTIDWVGGKFVVK